MRFWHIAAIVALAAVFFMIWGPKGGQMAHNAPPPSDGASAGTPPPSGTSTTAGAGLVDLQGKAVSLDEFRGKVVLLDFWATWCGPCRQAMPHTQAFSTSKAAAAGDLVVLAVNVAETKAEITAFMKENGFTMRVLMDRKGSVADSFKVNGIPNFIILGRDGNKRYQQAGLDEQALDAAVKKALAE